MLVREQYIWAFIWLITHDALINGCHRRTFGIETRLLNAVVRLLDVVFAFGQNAHQWRHYKRNHQRDDG